MTMNWKAGRLSAGQLRHRIDIVRLSPVQDSTGGFNMSSNVVYANVWASVEATDGTESMGANSQDSVSNYQIVIRYISAAPSWQPNYNYPGGFVIKDENGYLQQAGIGGGLSGADEPDPWNEEEGMYTEDGDPSTGFQWLNLGVAPAYSGLTAAFQVWWQGRQFQIKNVLNPDGRNKMQVLMCVEINDSRQQITAQPGDLT